MRRLSLLLLALLPALGLAQYTTIQDTLVKGDGSYFTGTVDISWPNFKASDNKQVRKGRLSVQVGASGAFSVALYPNDAATPAGTSYRIRYRLDQGLDSGKIHYWIVTTGGPLSIADVETSDPPTPDLVIPLSQIDNGSAAKGALIASNGTTWGSVPVGSNDQVLIADSAQSRGIKWGTVVPGTHASTHQHGGSDEVATATPAANAIPKADGSGDLADGWIPDAMARDSEIILGRASLTTAGRIAYITSTATLGQTDLYWTADILRNGTAATDAGIKFTSQVDPYATIIAGDASGAASLLALNLWASSTSEIAWSSRSRLTAPSDGTITLRNNAGDAFTMLQLGGTTSSFPAIKRSTTELQARLADDTAYTDFRASVFQVNTNGGLMYSAGDSAIRLASNSGGGILLETLGTDPINLATNDTTFWQISSAGLLAPQNSGAADFGSAGSTNPNKEGTTLPASCAIGQTYFKTDATAGQNTYGCTATDTWTLQGDGSGSGSPGGSGSELQYRVDGSTFGGVSNSSVSGSTITHTGQIDLSGGTFKPPASVVGSLPAASGVTNQIYLVTDGADPEDCDTGAGSTRVYCVSDGTAWRPLPGTTVAGASGGIQVSLSGLQREVDIVTSVVPRLASANAFTGAISFRNTVNYCADAGGTDAYACSISPAITAYTTGACYSFKANTANTGAATINFNTLGAKAIKTLHDQDPSNNDIEAGQVVTVCYDGTNMQMQSQVANAASGGSGDPQVYFMPKDAMFPATNGAYLQCRESSAGAPRPQWCETLYTTGDLATWDFVVPSTYSGTITAHVQYKMVSATANNTEWSSRLSCVTPGDATDVDADSFATADASADDTVPGTAGYLAEHTWTLSNTDGIAAGDLCVIQFERSTPTGTDATGDAEVRSFFLSW